jgi:diguanylate cyclase (GGDEF)-like protein
MFTSPVTTLTITSPSGHIYARIPDPKNITGQESLGYSLEEMMGNKSEDEFTTTKRLANYPFIVTIESSKESALAPWKKTVINIASLGLFVSAVLLFMTFRTGAYQRRQQETKEKLHLETITDPLTGLFNRRHVLKQAKIETKKASRNNTSLTIIILDLDQFKKVNDNYGHHRGDEALMATAEVIKSCCRETDILSRIGGEEFLMVLPDTDMQGALINAEKIRCNLEQMEFQDPSGVFHLTASLGVTEWAPGEIDISEAIQRTDSALYKVKNNGRNKVQAEPVKNEQKKSSESVVWLFK